MFALYIRHTVTVGSLRRYCKIYSFSNKSTDMEQEKKCRLQSVVTAELQLVSMTIIKTT